MKNIIKLFIILSILSNNIATYAKSTMGDFILSMDDFTVTAQDKNKVAYGLKNPVISFKAEKGDGSQNMTSKQFCGLWDKGQSFAKTPPNAMLDFRYKGNLYKVIFRISEAKQVQDTIQLKGEVYNKEAFQKDDKVISQKEFLEIAEESDKQAVSLIIDNSCSPWDPRC